MPTCAKPMVLVRGRFVRYDEVKAGPHVPRGLASFCTGERSTRKRKPLKIRAGMASLAVAVGAVALWSASPAGADPVVAQAASAANPVPSPTPTATPPPRLLRVSGFADAGYTSASVASAVGTPGGSTIGGRVFDTLNQQVQFHAFNLQAAYNGPIGGKIEVNFGDDANVINSYPKNTYAP